MNFDWAKKILNQGGKVRRPTWKPESYWKLSNDGFGRILWADGNPAKVHLRQLEENDWEIWEEIKDTLWRKRIGNPHYYGDAFDIVEVKKSIKELMDSATFCVMKEDERFMIKQIIKIFGRKLCSK